MWQTRIGGRPTESQDFDKLFSLIVWLDMGKNGIGRPFSEKSESQDTYSSEPICQNIPNRCSYTECPVSINGRPRSFPKTQT